MNLDYLTSEDKDNYGEVIPELVIDACEKVKDVREIKSLLPYALAITDSGLVDIAVSKLFDRVIEITGH